MTRFLIVGLIAAVAVPAGAQQKPISRADYQKVVDGHFNTADTNHDGFITKAELVAQQQRDLDQAKARINQQLREQFNRLDTNHDGKLTLQEFLGAAPPVKVAENADQMMARLDTNHDGRMSAEEWRSPEMAKFNRVDANHDGVVTPEEIRAANGK